MTSFPNGYRAKWSDIPNPDWVIVGAPLPDGTGVALLASRHLTYARLQEIATDTVYLEQMTAGWMKNGTFLSLAVGMDDFVMAAGPTYLDAFAALFEQWMPTTDNERLLALDAALAEFTETPKPLAIEAPQQERQIDAV